MDRYRSQAYERLSKGNTNNRPVNSVQSNGQLLKNSSDILHKNNGRQYLCQTQERQNIKKLLKALLALEESVESSSNLSPFQKAQMNNMLLSVQSLVQSLSIQYSDVEMPDYAYLKLTSLVESLENLVHSIIGDKLDETKYGIFQDRITNLSPSISSRSTGGNYEDELMERTNGLHIKGVFNNDNVNNRSRESEDEDSEFDDEEVSHVDDRFTNGSADRYKEPYRGVLGTSSGIRPPGILQFDGSSHPVSSFITPIRTTLHHTKGHLEHEPIRRNESRNMHRKPQMPYNLGGFSSRMNNVSFYGGQNLLASQETNGTFNQFPARNQATYDTSHIFS